MPAYDGTPAVVKSRCECGGGVVREVLGTGMHLACSRCTHVDFCVKHRMYRVLLVSFSLGVLEGVSRI